MGKIVELSRYLKPQGPQGPGGLEFFYPTEELLHMIYALIRPEGGHYKIALLAEQVDLPDLSLKAKENLVRRALELSVRIKKGESVHWFIGVHARTGILTEPLPAGTERVGDQVRFESE